MVTVSMKCKDLNIKFCPICEKEYYWGKTKTAPKCWIEEYSSVLAKLDGKELKDYFLEQLFPQEDWVYYFHQTAKNLFPEKLHIIEKILILR